MANTIRLTTQSNILTLSRNFLKVMEKRILYAIVDTVSPRLNHEITEKVSKAAFEERGLEYHGKELSYQLGTFDISKITYRAKDICRPDQYEQLRDALEGLKNRSFILDTPEMTMGTSLVLKYKFSKRAEIIELTIDEELFQILLNLDYGYTTLQAKVAISLSSEYATKIYELLCKVRDKDFFIYTLEELRFFTDTTNLYEKTNDWKKRVLDVAKKKLDESEATDIRFTYKEIKKGRAIVGFKFFIIKTEKSHEYQNIMRQRQPSANWDMPLWATAALKTHGIQLKGKSKEYALAFYKKYPEDAFKRKIEEYVLKAHDSQKAVAPYLMKSIKNDLGIK